MKSPLPVPEIIEENECSFSFKQPRGSHEAFHLRRPPKLQQTCNRTLNASIANVVSFREDDGQMQLSALYNRSRPETYYEQCFEQLAKVGEGSFGEVFKVRSLADGRLYAVKKSKEYYRSEHGRQKCLEEVRQYEQFSDHENCVKLHQAWEQDDTLYMQMELCRENLEVYAREQQQLSDERIWSILLDLLLALKSLHDRNLIHLDIKLDNILVTDDGTCKLADFGLVFDLSKGNTENATEGDSRYLAPELMSGRYTKAADIFSLGIATLELTCNLDLPSCGHLWQRLRSGQPLPEYLARKISFPLREIIVHMMKPQPEDRPTVEVLLRHPIIKKLHESRRRRRIVGRLRTYFHRKLSSLWRFVMTAVMWFTGCLRLQHRKFPAGESGTDADQSAKERNCRGTGSRNGISFGASRSFQDQVSSLLADEEGLYDDSLLYDSSACSTNAVECRSHWSRAGGQDDTDGNEKDSSALQITPTLNNFIPTRTPTVRIVNSTPLNHLQLKHNLQNGNLQLQHSRNGSRHASRVLCSPLRLLWFEEDVHDLPTKGDSSQMNSTTSPIPSSKHSIAGRFNDSDSDIRPLGSSPQNLDASVYDKAANGPLSSSAVHENNIPSTPNCSLLRSTSASTAAGGDTPPSGSSSFLIKKKLCFTEDNDSE
uniref:Membrane-associated tyrosine- and threonine-specific cdc2-inhibitory kinase n=1 Tax=Anopheles atroparvus TaxID=41427 RepID=A0A182JJK6_ANOAO